MKKISGWAIFGNIMIAIIVAIGITGVTAYNGLVGLKENVDNQSSNIDVQLQRRIDLIPNLVNTVKGITTHENAVLTEIANARAKLAGATTMPDKASANDQLSSTLNKLLVVVENYPNIRSNDQFKALMDELAGTENRIAVARKDYNDAVTAYNSRLKTFPANMVAGMFSFASADYFVASSASAEAPTVSFS
jgi:LemA protein